MFDFGVNAGPGRSVELLQRTLGLAADGVVGPKTLAACELGPAPMRTFLAALSNAHEAYYKSLPGYAHDGDGWTARVNAAHVTALSLAAGLQTPALAPALPKPRLLPAAPAAPSDDNATDALNSESAAGTLPQKTTLPQETP